MKTKIILSVCTILLLASCVQDNGNYDYELPEVPVILLNKSDNPYPAEVGEIFRLDPATTFSEPSRLHFLWQITDVENMTSYDYEGRVLEFLYTLKPQAYPILLTVTDTGNGQKYFFKTSIEGQTELSRGTFMLTELAGGKSNLVFINRAGVVADDFYSFMNDGEELPDGPKQLIPLRHTGYGNVMRWVWMIGSDTEKGGVMLDPNTMVKIKYLSESYYDPKTEIKPGYYTPKISSNETADPAINGIEDGGFYVGNSFTYFADPTYGKFGIPAPGSPQTLAPIYAEQKETNAALCYDLSAKVPLAILYAAPGGMYMNMPPMNPFSVSLSFDDIYSIMTNSSMGLIVGSDNGTKSALYLSGLVSFPMVTVLGRADFGNQALVTSASKWVVTQAGTIFFSSGAKLYKLTPLFTGTLSLTVDEMTNAVLQGGDITMLKAVDSNTIAAGTNGYLYYLDITAGQDGKPLASHTVNGFNGKLIDFYIRD